MAKSAAQRQRERRARLKAEKAQQSVVALGEEVAGDLFEDALKKVTPEFIVAAISHRFLHLCPESDASPRDLVLLADWLIRNRSGVYDERIDARSALKEFMEHGSVRQAEEDD